MEFQKVILEAARLCDHYFNENGGCDNCPLEMFHCDNIFRLDENELAEYEDIVMEFSRNYPRPIYPTYRELIRSMLGENDEHEIENILDKRIPENTAKKFGIVPINECGLSKYVDGSSEWR